MRVMKPKPSVTRWVAFVWVPLKISLCLFWREIHTKGVERGIGRRGGKECPREDRESQLTKETRRKQSAEGSSQEMSQHCLWLCGSFAQIHACDNLQMHGELHKNVTNSLLLHLELTQVRVCSFVLFFHPLGCVLCVRKEMCNAPGRRWEKNARWITSHE